MSSPTFTGEPQCSPAAAAAAGVAVEPLGLHATASCCPFGFPAGVLPLLKGTTSFPFGKTTGSEPWLKLQACGLSRGSKKSPKKQRVGELPLISSGGDHLRPPFVDIEPKIGDWQ